MCGQMNAPALLLGGGIRIGCVHRSRLRGEDGYDGWTAHGRPAVSALLPLGLLAPSALLTLPAFAASPWVSEP